MFHVYTYGQGSIQFLILTQKQADLVNEFHARFSEAQEIFFQRNGRRWTVNEPLSLNKNYPKQNLQAYNKLTKSLNRQHAIRNRIYSLLRIDVSKEEFDDYLVKRF